MQASYHLTEPGLLYSLASSPLEKQRQLLLNLLKNNIDTPFSFADIVSYCNNDKEVAFKHVCDLLQYELIDLTEESDKAAKSSNPRNLKNCDFVLSDLNGLTINHQGFSSRQAIELSAMACDYIKVSKRTWEKYQSNHIYSPISIETNFQDKAVTIFLLHFGYFNSLLISNNSEIYKHSEFMNFASFLCNRYSHD